MTTRRSVPKTATILAATLATWTAGTMTTVRAVAGLRWEPIGGHFAGRQDRLPIPATFDNAGVLPQTSSRSG
jgi:hypothetical protein